MCFQHIGAPKKLCQNVFAVPILSGADIQGAIREAIHLAGNLTVGRRNAEITFAFQGILVTVTCESRTDSIYQAWQRAKPGQAVGPIVSEATLSRLRKEWQEKNSPVPQQPVPA